MFNLNGTEDLNTHTDPIAGSKGLAPKAEGTAPKTEVLGRTTQRRN